MKFVHQRQEIQSQLQDDSQESQPQLQDDSQEGQPQLLNNVNVPQYINRLLMKGQRGPIEINIGNFFLKLFN